MGGRTGMRGAGAAKRREQEQDEPPDGAEAVAGLLKATAAIDAVLGRMNRRDGDIARIVAALEEMGAACGNAERFAALAGEIATGQSLQLVELIACGTHAEEARAAAGHLAAVLGLRASVYEAGIAEGRRREAADRDAQAPAPRARHARKRHLNPVPGLGSAAGRAAMAAGVTVATLGGGIAAMHEESAVRTVASVPAAATGVHRMPPDVAVPFPSSAPRAYVPRHARPAADAASASPAPPSSPPVFTPAPQPPPPPPSPAQASAAPSGTLNVQTVRVAIAPGVLGQVSFTVVGAALGWTAVSSSPSVTVSTDPLSAGGPQASGVLGDRQSAVLYISVAAGSGSGSGWVTVTAGGQSVDVPVTWAAGPGAGA